MTKRIKLKQSTTRRVRLGPSRTRSVDPELVKESLGAERVARVSSRGSPFALAALGRALVATLRSSGGRPSIEGAVRRQKIPMSEADWRALEEISSKLDASGLTATPGQIASQLLREAIATLRTTGGRPYPSALSAGRSLRVSDSANPTALPAVPNELRVLLRDAMNVLSAATHHDANALFGARVFEPADRSPTAAHAMGVVDGAAVALGMTALELLTEMGLCPPGR